MTEAARLARNRQRIEEMFPWFGERVLLVIRDLERTGFRPRIQSAWRSPQDQLKAYYAHTSKLQWGFHCATGAHGKPEALAGDVLDDDDVNDDGQANLSRGLGYVFALARAARQHHLATGILWGLPVTIKAGLDAAIERNDLTWRRDRIGWDPFHVEVVGLSASAARKGARPS